MISVSGVGVIDKSMVVLRAVAQRPLGLAELEATTGLPRATANRLANALVDHGLLRKDPQQRYDLGGELLALGHIARQRFPLVEIAAPFLAELGSITSESVQLFVTEGDARRCVASLPTAHALQWIVPEGALYPLGQGSAGRALLGEIPPGQWIATIAEREAGVASVSAPIAGANGTIVGAVSVSGPIERLGTDPGGRFGPEVALAATGIAQRLSGSTA